jgi:hypothetical protein
MPPFLFLKGVVILRKLNTEIVKKEAEKYGYKLIGEYKEKEKITIECKNGHRDKIWVHRLKYKVCKECKKQEKALEIRKEIESQGYTLHNEYEGCYTVLRMTCKNGHLRECRIDSFRKNGCEQCANEENMKNIIKQLEDEGYTIHVIPENTHGVIEATCKNGHFRKAKVYNFLNHGCPQCNEKRNYSYDFEYVKEVFDSKGYTLLATEYINCKQYLPYICSCGEYNETTFDAILNSDKLYCNKCKGKYISGENHPNWNGGISEVTHYLREHIVDWKRRSMEACGYKCMITGEKYIEVHHLHPFHLILEEIASIVDFEIKQKIGEHTSEELDLLEKLCIDLHNKYGLGICLSPTIHRQFHSIYGNRNNTVEQFISFVKEFYPEKLDEVEKYIIKNCFSMNL